jgi:rhodanese-related sulfurtransferase
MTPFTYSDVRRVLLARSEIALIDLREEHPFAQAHPLWAANLALSRLDLDASRRIPRRDTLIVLYGEHEGVDLVPAAMRLLATWGYTNLHALAGGLDGWREAGGELFRDVNVPSKAFGELVEHERHTPSLSAQEVKDLIENNADVVVLDARRYDEYQTMSIPTAISVPGAELVLRARDLAPNPSTRVIVNCAGRTRSLIGTQSLVNAGLPNPVAALRNGTIGWKLAGQVLDHGAARRAPSPSPENITLAQDATRAVAGRAGVQWIGLEAVDALQTPGRTVYRFDVRTPEEYAVGSLAGFASAPGGQLVQETDHQAPVRGARIVLADDDGVRAPMTASWLAQMGWEVYVVDGLLPSDFGTRSPQESGDNRPSLPNPNRYRRPYEGTDAPAEAMQAYLDWEFGLVAQLARDGTHHFKVI